MSLTYVYCLVRAARRPVLRGVRPMPGGEAVRLLDAGERMWLVVSSVTAADYDEAALARGLQDLDWVGRRAVAHEAVVERFLGAAAVLPMQLFTLFASDERALHSATKDRRRIERILKRIEHQVEWGLRLSFDDSRMPDARAAGDTGARAQRNGRPSTRLRPRGESGASYLARKRDLIDRTRAQFAAAKSEAGRLYRALAREATEARRRTATENAAPGSRLLLDAAFLVPAKGAASFRASLRRSAKALTAAGVVVSLTGPWPPYNFVTQARGKG